MAADNDYQGAMAEKSELPSYLKSLSDRRGAHLVDVALPWRGRREDTHIACRSSVSTEIV